MDDSMVTAGVLLEAAQNQQKIAEASFQKLDALASLLRDLPRDTTPDLKAAIETAIRQELAGARQDILALTGALRAARVRMTRTLAVIGAAVVLAAVLSVGALLLWVLPSSDDIARLRAEKATLTAGVADLTARAGKIQLRNCGDPGQKLRVCARVDPTSGPFGTKAEPYMVLAGY